MREFMTKMSDYLNEMRNNPEKREDRLAVVIIGTAAVVVIVLLLLILWGHIVRDRKQREAENEIVSTTYEEHVPEYMAPNDGQEELMQAYLADIASLNDKIEELLATLTQVEQNLSETVIQYQEEDAVLREEITSLHTKVNTIVRGLKETQTKLQDLFDIVMIMDKETIPMIQAQITQIREEMNGVHADIADLYAKIAALEQEDIKLWESIGNLGEMLQAALDENMTEVNNQINIVFARIEALENRISRLAGQILQYRYDEEKNTLYLEPYKE